MTKDNVHPALEKRDTTVINLRTVPAPLHRALKIAAMDAGETLESFIIGKLAEMMGIAPF